MNRLIGWVGLVLCLFLVSCGSYPYDTQTQDDADLQKEIQEGKSEQWYDRGAEEYDAQQERSPDLIALDTPSPPCPRGCSTPKPNCLIKGNISAKGEKIYHMPGQEYYDQTEIDLVRGERWFCTPAEAEKNGWRLSKK